MVEDNKVPVLFSVLPVLVDVEDFNSFFVHSKAVCSKSLFKSLNVFIVKVVMVSLFCLIIRQRDEAVLNVKARV